MTSVSASRVASRHLRRVGGSVDPDYAYLLASVLKGLVWKGLLKVDILDDLPSRLENEIIPAVQQISAIDDEDIADVRSLVDHMRAGLRRDDLVPFEPYSMALRSAWRIAFREDRYSDWINAIPLDYGPPMRRMFHAAMDAVEGLVSPAIRTGIALLPNHNPFRAQAPDVFAELAEAARRCRAVGVPVASEYTQHMLAVRRLTDVDFIRRIDPEYREKIAYLLSSEPEGVIQAAELAELVA